MRLREEVKSPDAVDLVGWTCTYDHADVSRLRVHVARNIDDMCWPKRDELFDEFVVAAAPWRIDHNGRVLGWIADIDKNVFRVTREKLCIRDSIELGILLCAVDRGCTYLHASNLMEARRKCEGEQTRATVRVNQVLRLLTGK